MVNAVISDIGNVVAFWDGMKIARTLATHFPDWTPEDIDQRLQWSDEGLDLHRRFETAMLTDVEFMREVGFLFGHETHDEWFWPAHTDIFTPNKPVIDLWREVQRQPAKSPVIALSDTDPRRLPFVLEVSRMTFDSIVASYHCGMRKPDPRIFELAVRVAGVDAENCLFVDDRKPFTDAAERLGLKAHQYDPKDPERDIRLRKTVRQHGLIP